MGKDEMVEYIMSKLRDADYLNIEMVYGLVLGLMGK